MQTSNEEPFDLAPFLESKRGAVNLFLVDVVIKIFLIYGISYDAKAKRHHNPIYFKKFGLKKAQYNSNGEDKL